MPSRTLQPELRLIIVPDAAPPYDCDAHGPACPARRDPAGPEPRGVGPAAGPVRPRSPGARAVTPAPPALLSSAPASPGSSAAAAASVWPRQFAQVLVEILAGARSLRQIVPCTTDRVRANIDAFTPQAAAGARPRIQRVVMSYPTAHAVEMTVIVRFGPRSRALALRCEHLPARPAAPGRPSRPARWLCTELETG